MMGSALVLGAIGISLTFLPQEIAAYIDPNHPTSFQILFQLLGALYFACAMLNWMAKESVIGGIYNRPIAIANFTHFLIGGLALAKVVLRTSNLPLALPILASVYTLFALLFGYIFYNNPTPAGKQA